MVRFKVVKYKHYRKACELIESDAPEAEHFAFVISMVEEWDFKDAETGKALPAEFSSMDELSIDQFNEAMELFNQEMGLATKVKKTNGGSSSSTLTPSSPDVSQAQTHPTGYIPLYSPAEKT